MKIILFFFVLLLASRSWASNLTNFWFTNGTIKMARQDLYPGGASTNTITRNWDGTNAKMFGARNETVFGVLYLLNNSGSDATQVNVKVSSFTGPLGFGIVPVVVSSMSVWDSNASGPVNLFYVRYLPIRGETQNSWDATEYEERDFPPRFQVPFTVNGNNQGVANSPILWVNRPDHDKFYPDILVPMEEVAVSSFTVAKSSSQAIGIDIYVGKTLPAGTYTGTLTVQEGVSVSTVIPVNLLVYNFTLPDQPSLTVLGAVGGANINLFHQNNEFPPAGDPYRTTRKHYYQFVRRHGIVPIGDDVFQYEINGAEDFPTPEYQVQLDGSLFTAGQGYAGRSAGLPVPLYMIGTYRNWDNPTYWSNSVTGGPIGFCTNLSSWSANLSTYGGRVAFYTYDEPDDVTLNTVANKYAVWIATACNITPKFVNSWVTALWTHVNSSATAITMPASTDWIGSGFPNSAATWQTLAAKYETTGATQAWAYNGHPSWDGTMFATEDDGISPMVPFLADYKKGVQGHFLWDIANYKNPNNSPSQVNDLFNDAKTFGTDLFPSTSAARGRNGNAYSNGDGVLVYPGTDKQDTANSYGFDGAMASWRLKLVRSGIQYYDYLTAAHAVNASSTTAILNALVPEVLWEHKCFNDVSGVDCSYSYGGRQWPSDPNLWENDRERLAMIASSTAGPSSQLKGSGKIRGGTKLK